MEELIIRILVLVHQYLHWSLTSGQCCLGEILQAMCVCVC